MGTESGVKFQAGDIVRVKDTDVGYDEIQKGALYEVADRDLYGHVLLVGQDHTWGAHHFELVYRPGSGVDLEGMKLYTPHGAIPLHDVGSMLDVMFEEGCPPGENIRRAAWLKSKFNCARQSDARDRLHWKERYRLAARLDEANQEIDKLKRDLADCAQRDAKSKALETQLALALQKAKYSDDAANEAVREMKLAREERHKHAACETLSARSWGSSGSRGGRPTCRTSPRPPSGSVSASYRRRSPGSARPRSAASRTSSSSRAWERDELADELQGELGRKGFMAQVETRAPAGVDIDGTPLFVGDTVVGVNCNGQGCGGRNGDFHKISRTRGSVDGVPVVYMTDTTVGLANRFRKQSK